MVHPERSKEAESDGLQVEGGSTAPAVRAVEVARPRRRLNAGARVRQPRRSGLANLRDSPVRNGLIGLAVVGSAAPIAVNRYQQALRTDPSHEHALLEVPERGNTELAIREAWRSMKTAQDAEEAAREAAIQRNLEKYTDYDLTRELAEQIYDVAQANEIDPEIAFGLVRAESSFRNTSMSPVGAIGLTQLMPRTAAGIEPGVTRTQLKEPATNLRIGFKYLRSLLDKYGETDLALIAYNRGPGTVDRELKRGRDPDNGYAAFVRGLKGHGHRLFTAQ